VPLDAAHFGLGGGRVDAGHRGSAHAGSLSGRVFYQINDVGPETGIAGLTVQARLAGSSTVVESQTNASGVYQFADLPDGIYRLAVQGESRTRTYFYRGGPGSYANFTVTSASSRNDADFEARVILEGNIAPFVGAPVQDASVNISFNGRTVPVRNTNASGNFKFIGPPRPTR
jgi:hypothetical protein